ncbi:MAG: transcription termination factor NusA, partial [Candidatus Moraniibacteriota bacterium]
IPGENYRMGQHLKVFLTRVESDPKGPGLILSRAHPEMVRHLFTLEVPEIATGTVEIKAIAREAGSRTKIAVSANEDGVDPIGSCVGQKGTRVQTVIDELGGEKVDIIEWNEDVQKFISASLSPAKVLSVELREEDKQAIVTVPADQLSLAIGKRGQNVRLAAKLTGWRIDVKSPEEVVTEGEEVETETEALAENESITETVPEATEVTPISAEASPEAVAEEKE